VASLVIVVSAVVVSGQTDRQTNRQTDRQTDADERCTHVGVSKNEIHYHLSC